jgi:hypothetical protein
VRDRRRTTRGALWIAAALMTGFISGCLGCGGAKVLRVGLDRDATYERPVWVGVYFVNSATALDGRENAELTTKENAKNFGPPDGVIGTPSIQPVYPGRDPIIIPMEDYDPAISHILVVANYPDPGDCSRLKVPVKKGSSLTLMVSVGAECLKIAGKK